MAPDPFDVLGLEPRFDLDPARVQRAYLERSGVLHPDRAGDALTASGAASADLNAARRALADPEQRAAALLARLGGPGRGQERSLLEGFLAEMLAVGEHIEQARAARDAGALQGWAAWADERRRGHVDTVARLFGGLGTPPAPGDLTRIRRELNAWRYTERLIEQIEAPEGSAGAGGAG